MQDNQDYVKVVLVDWAGNRTADARIQINERMQGAWRSFLRFLPGQ